MRSSRNGRQLDRDRRTAGGATIPFPLTPPFPHFPETARMASESVVELTDSNFETEVVQSESPVLVDFWAPWCQPCMRLGPTIDALAEEFQGRVKVGKVNIDENQQAAMKHGIMSIPTLLVFRGGEIVEKFVGLTDKDELKSSLDKALGA